MIKIKITYANGDTDVLENVVYVSGSATTLVVSFVDITPQYTYENVSSFSLYVA